MRANEYQTRAMSTRLPSCENATYMLFGLMAEIGEIADKIAKWRRKGVCRLDMDHLVFNTGDLQEVEGYKSELMKEVGDCAWFIAGIADCFGFTLEEVMQQNLDKLASRRERGVIDGKRTMAEVLDAVEAELAERGLDGLSRGRPGNYAWFRRHELAATLNRLRTLRVG